MDSEILHQLELIRVYIFIMMCAITAWATFKIVLTIQNILIGFKKVWDTTFLNRIDKHFDLGNYQEIIDECKEIIEKYPSHSNATWFLAKAYYHLNKQPEAVKYFNKAVELAPSWKNDANDYIELLNERLNIYYKG